MPTLPRFDKISLIGATFFTLFAHPHSVSQAQRAAWHLYKSSLPELQSQGCCRSPPGKNRRKTSKPASWPWPAAGLQMFLLFAGLLSGEGRVPSRITRGTEKKVLGSKVSALDRKLAGFWDLSSCRWCNFACLALQGSPHLVGYRRGFSSAAVCTF